MSQQMMRDMVQHCDRRIVKVITDTLDSCTRLDMSRDDKITVALGSMVHALVKLALIVKFDEAELHQIVSESFRVLQARAKLKKESTDEHTASASQWGKP